MILTFVKNCDLSRDQLSETKQIIKQINCSRDFKPKLNVFVSIETGVIISQNPHFVQVSFGQKPE